LFATNPDTGKLFRYDGTPDQWTETGGPGATFAVGDRGVYGLTPDGSGVHRWSGDGTGWTALGAPVKATAEPSPTQPTPADPTAPPTPDSTAPPAPEEAAPPEEGPPQAAAANAAGSAYGRELAVTAKDGVYALAADHGSVWKRDGDTEWVRIGGPAETIRAGRAGVFTLHPDTGRVHKYDEDSGQWTEIGEPSAGLEVTGDHVYRVAADHSAVYEWSHKGTAWDRIGGPAKDIYAGAAGLFATRPDNGNIYKYDGDPDEWTEAGGPGAAFAVSDDHLYGLTPDRSAVTEYDGKGKPWKRIGGPAQDLYAAGAGLFATSPADGHIFQYDGEDEPWKHVGSPGAAFAASDDHLYGLTPDRSAVFRRGGDGEWSYAGGPAQMLQEQRDEEMLRQECGSCVEEYREARTLTETDVTDWLKDNGGKILLDLLGAEDAVECLSIGTELSVDVGKVASCLSTAANLSGIITAIRKSGQVAKAVTKVSRELPKYTTKVSNARNSLTKYRDLLEKIKKNPFERQYKPQVPDCRVGGRGWRKYGDLDTANGDRATPMVACLDKAFINDPANAGTATKTKEVKPPAYQWAVAKTYELGNTSHQYWRNACHLLAKQLTGDGLNLQNISTCSRAANANPNTPDDPGLPEPMTTFEDKVKKAIDGDQIVRYQVTPQYSGPRTVPVSYEMTALGITADGKPGLVLDEVVPNMIYSNKYKYYVNLGLFTEDGKPVPVAGEK
ncbi:DNA/RNA non-specific endonuclease, partial [Streptomyces sp. NBS 14/10]|uniref:DNA/RNA non-specific endonuclease n=1 Tax=Streptomyces sp. NBS 14/10 TaxID=1945643 RepID=UPI000B7D5092